VKLEFFKRPSADQGLFFREAAERRGILPVMVEKDFWISWILAVLFSHPTFSKQLIFKGGTSLSKVFGVIERFSEDIDLSVNPSFLGIVLLRADLGPAEPGNRSSGPRGRRSRDPPTGRSWRGRSSRSHGTRGPSRL